jgi:Fe-S-cluster containining protein
MPLCDDCNAACCRQVVIRLGKVSDDQGKWCRMHGALDSEGLWRLAVPCQHVTDDGRCAIYGMRPQVCRDYEAGGARCLAAREAMG